MANYMYEGIDERGARQKGIISASGRIEAAAKLREKLLTVVALHKESWLERCWARRPGRGYGQLRLDFCRHMYIMLGAGVPVLEAVRIFAGDAKSARKNSMERLRQHLADGYSLSESMQLLENEFSRIMVVMVQGGEMSGNLPDVFEKMYLLLKKRQENMQKLELAMTYPCLLCLAGSAIVVLLLHQVLPVFAEVFAGFGAELPQITRLLLTISEHIAYLAFAAVTGMVLIVLLCLAGKRVRWLGMKLGRLAISLPVWGKLKQRSEQALFFSVLALMVHSGIRLHYGIGIARNISRNMYWQFSCDSMSAQLEQGYSLGVCMEKSGMFPASVLSMIKAGEQSGELAKMLEYAGEACQGEAELLLERVQVLAEPLIIMLLGAAAGFIVLSTVLPILDLMCVM